MVAILLAKGEVDLVVEWGGASGPSRDEVLGSVLPSLRMLGLDATERLFIYFSD